MYGVSLTDLIDARRGRDILDYVDGLPSASRLREAILNDPHEAALIAALPEPDEEWAPRISEWTLSHALQYDQRSLLVAILQTLESTATGKRAKQIPALPSPRTAVDQARADALRARIDDMKNAFGYRPPPD